MSALTVDIRGRATTPFTLRFENAYVSGRKRTLSASYIHRTYNHYAKVYRDPDPGPGKLGGATFDRLHVEISVDHPGGEARVYVSRLEGSSGHKSMWELSGPKIVRHLVGKALHESGGFDRVFEATGRAHWADNVPGLIKIAETLETRARYLREIADFAEFVATLDDVEIDLIREDPHELPYAARHGLTTNGTLDTGPPSARLMLHGEQIGWLSTKGEPVPLERPKGI